jgi:hypothetical protein
MAHPVRHSGGTHTHPAAPLGARRRLLSTLVGRCQPGSPAADEPSTSAPWQQPLLGRLAQRQRAGWPDRGPIRSYAPKTRAITREVDTVELNEALSSGATLLEAIALPVLRHGHLLDPEQASATLERVAWLAWGRGRRGSTLSRRGGGPIAGEEAVLLHEVLEALGARLAAVAGDCTDEQLARGLWGLGMARWVPSWPHQGVGGTRGR